MKVSNIHILILRLVLGGLFLSIGLEKINEGWLTSPESLMKSLTRYHEHATGYQLRYLDRVAIPHANLWSKLMACGELALGVSLLLGLLLRLSTFLGILMVLNFYAANGSLYSLDFFGGPWSALVTSSLVILFLTRAGRVVGADALFAKANPKGILW